MKFNPNYIEKYRSHEWDFDRWWLDDGEHTCKKCEITQSEFVWNPINCVENTIKGIIK